MSNLETYFTQKFGHFYLIRNFIKSNEIFYFCVIFLQRFFILKFRANYKISSFCTSSHDFDTHFLHFHLTMDSLCFSNWLTIYTSNTDFHRLAKRHACRTHKGQVIINLITCPTYCNLLLKFF